jgi:hypothetical protein
MAEVVGLKGARRKPSNRSVPLWMPDDYLRSIEPLIAIVLKTDHHLMSAAAARSAASTQ